MQLIHSLPGLEVKKTNNEEPPLFLSNRKGSYFFLENIPKTRYSGFFYYDLNKGQMFRIIENIRVNTHTPVLTLKNNFVSVERKRKLVWENFFMPFGYHSLVYTLNKSHNIDLFLDFKLSYDNRVWGRNYDVVEKKDCLLVCFTKKTDQREDDTHHKKEYSLFLAIKGYEGYKKRMHWVEREYSSDEGRNSPPFKRYVLDALSLQGQTIVFSVAHTKKNALKEAAFIHANRKKLFEKQKAHAKKFLSTRTIKKVMNSKKLSKEVKMAYICSAHSLLNLSIAQKIDNIFAGLPWFFQFWSRDTLISLRSLSNLNHALSKKILLTYLSKIGENGRLPNTLGISRGPGSADAGGWLFQRAEDFDIPKEILLRSLTRSVDKLLTFSTTHDYDVNHAKETWMDTSSDGYTDAREGVRIEIQALRLHMYRFLYYLSNDYSYKEMEEVLNEKVEHKFWNGKILADGLDDFTIRPNIFIMAYVYPELITNKDWEKCFTNSLPKLWLPWGGLSTIDKSNHLFTDTHTGEDVTSYHRGDSWFWINNLAALILKRTNEKKFRKYTKKILEASTQEILWQGVLGCHTELSSAKKLRSEGCANQAWSNAMFMELVDEIV